MIEAVIIDFDDTLSMTEGDCFSLENEALRRMGRPAMTREVHQATWGKPLYEAITERSPGVDVDEFRACLEPSHKEFSDAGRIDVVTPENLAAIDQLRGLARAVMILTSRTLPEMEHILSPSQGLSERITAVYHRDNMQYHKPDPRAFRQIEIEHGFTPSACLYVGDSIGDAQSAKGAGLHFVASLESGLRTKTDFADYPVDDYIMKFPEIVPIVQRLNRSTK